MNMIAGHLEAERISALLDEPWADRDGQAHLETCGDCQAEFERLSRMRMALSALPEERPPRGEWASIEAALDARESGMGGRWVGRRFAGRLLVPGPLQAAAGLMLFAGGVIAGLQFTRGGAGETTADLPRVVSPADDRTLLEGLNRLESLRTPLRQVGEGAVSPGSASGDRESDPIEIAQSLVRLDGSIRALRDQLETDPGDFFASAYLLELVELRDRLTDELGRASAVRTW
ncbi:hypothetical protein [Candidatus Palauibacter sp.]|uniref:hypothetical protein n=1 Tax=Candidatus Palauibacter sp. TaxID=3101350 RepID=UPI003AF2AD86